MSNAQFNFLFLSRMHSPYSNTQHQHCTDRKKAKYTLGRTSVLKRRLTGSKSEVN